LRSWQWISWDGW